MALTDEARGPRPGEGLAGFLGSIGVQFMINGDMAD